MILTNNFSLSDLRETCQKRLTGTFQACLDGTASDTLQKAMANALRAGGKRVRPLLVYAAGLAFQAPLDHLDFPAAAIELIHTYSLIHDDLPCMDNADLRRGQPTCHKVVGEGMAVLTGDALLTLAMQLLSHPSSTLSSDRRLRMIHVLSQASGPHGMAGGQALDITLLANPSLTIDELLLIYRLKTGCLLSASLELGWLASDDNNPDHAATLRQLGHWIGLAFQIQDDLLDIEANPQTSGKPQGQDAALDKMTYPRLAGIPAAREKVGQLYRDAGQAIDSLGEHATLLRQLIESLLTRSN